MNKREIAARAERLRGDETFQDVMQAVREAQARVFLSHSSSPEEREQAHQVIRALHFIDTELEARVVDHTIEQKGQHRGSD